MFVHKQLQSKNASLRRWSVWGRLRSVKQEGWKWAPKQVLVWLGKLSVAGADQSNVVYNSRMTHRGHFFFVSAPLKIAPGPSPLWKCMKIRETVRKRWRTATTAEPTSFRRVSWGSKTHVLWIKKWKPSNCRGILISWNGWHRSKPLKNGTLNSVKQNYWEKCKQKRATASWRLSSQMAKWRFYFPQKCIKKWYFLVKIPLRKISE